MQSVESLLDAFAEIFLYPRQDYRARLKSCIEQFSDEQAEARDMVVDYCSQIEGLSHSDLEELYIKTFDLNKTCTLDLGWHLFGEDYNRGLFLVKLRQYLRALDISETDELPDHISHVLRIIGRMSRDEANRFAYACVIPALEVLGNEVQEDNPNHLIVHALVILLRNLFEVPPGFEETVDEDRVKQFEPLPIIQ